MKLKATKSDGPDYDLGSHSIWASRRNGTLYFMEKLDNDFTMHELSSTFPAPSQYVGLDFVLRHFEPFFGTIEVSK